VAAARKKESKQRQKAIIKSPQVKESKMPHAASKKATNKS
jgi:hypothetical protein